ncbi:MAG: 2-hydroxychromene-2-carboxylate isomerase [Pseudomonadota bacterium]
MSAQINGIDYYLTTVSPYAYLAGDRPERIAAKHGLAIRYLPVDLGKVFPTTGGLPLPKRAPARKAYRMQELRRWSAHLGMAMTLEPKFFPVNGQPTGLAVIAAQRLGADAGALARWYLSALWTREQDLADPAVVAEGLAEVGLGAEAVTAEDEATFEANAEAALRSGVFGAPSFVAGEELFWGQDRLEMLDGYLSGDLSGRKAAG